MPNPVYDLQELKDLYLIDKLTLKQIGEKFGVSKQAIHSRLQLADVELRPRSRMPLNIDRETLLDLYVNQKLSPAKIGEKFGLTNSAIRQYLIKNNVPIRGRGESFIKYPQIREMKPGESIELPRSKTKKNPFVDYYMMAKKAGIRVSMQTIDEETLRLTRVS